MKMCIAGVAIGAVVGSAGTYVGVTLTQASPGCVVQGNPAACKYLGDLASAGLPVPSNAINAAGIICVNLRSGVTMQAQAQAFALAHPDMTPSQAELYIQITQNDMC